ncbi:hypothetical protein, partial [Pseudomonas syringae]|uniref:hypothetical protein n=1 Tax=Pseudomonas syringae TaxID=317 RepID=UPI001C1F3E1D
FSHHFHTNHLVFSCSESEQKQLNTWVSFRSATTIVGSIAITANGSSECTMPINTPISVRSNSMGLK